MIIRKHPWFTLTLLVLWSLGLVQWLFFNTWGLNVLCIYALGALLCILCASPASRGWLWLILGGGCCLSFTLWDHRLLSPLLALAAPLCFVTWILGGLPRSWLQALYNYLPFQFAGSVFSLLDSGLRQRQNLGRIALGVLLALPLLLISGLLLASAESAFGELFSRLLTALGDDMLLLVIKLVLALGLSLYAYCLLLRGCQPPQTAAASRPKGDSLIISVVLGLLCGLHLLFLGVSCQVLPQLTTAGAHTLSHYARQGFFELCAAALLNLGVFLGIKHFKSAQAGAPRLLSLLLAILTLALIALAAIKMGLYIHLCGLTLMRFYTSCFMAVMALFFVALMVSLFRPLPVVRLGIVMLVCALCILGLVNAEGFIAQSNVERYLSGDLSTLDLDQYQQFPSAAAPALIKAYEETDDPILKNALLIYLQHQPLPAQATLWESSHQAQQARQLLSPFQR